MLEILGSILIYVLIGIVCGCIFVVIDKNVNPNETDKKRVQYFAIIILFYPLILALLAIWLVAWLLLYSVDLIAKLIYYTIFK